MSEQEFADYREMYENGMLSEDEFRMIEAAYQEYESLLQFERGESS